MAVKFIIGHWTAGALKPNQTDLNSYQLLIDGNGKTYTGMPVGKAASTGGMNSITYNIACCGGLSWSRLTRVQIEKFYKTCAEKLIEYNLAVDRFYTHAEIGEMCRDKSITKLIPWNDYLAKNKGKVDLTILPIDDNHLNFKADAGTTGSKIRSKIKVYYDRIKNKTI